MKSLVRKQLGGHTTVGHTAKDLVHLARTRSPGNNSDARVPHFEDGQSRTDHSQNQLSYLRAARVDALESGISECVRVFLP